jgi:hypothetical protein
MRLLPARSSRIACTPADFTAPYPTNAMRSSPSVSAFRVPTFLLILTAALFAASCASGGASTSEPVETTPAPGGEALFTQAQADRGEAVYEDVCLECHTRVEFKEDAFLFAWEGASVGRLLSYLMENMPDESPGSLPERSYLDVTAYILQMNGWSAGDTELMNDEAALRAVRFEAR